MIRRQVVVPAPPEEVWDFLTAPDKAGAWLGGRLTWQAEEGRDLSFAGDDGGARRGVVEAVRAARYLRFRWWPADGGDGPATVVAYILEPDDDRTRLTVQETIDIRPLPGPAGVDPTGGGRGTAPSASVRSGGGWSGADDRCLQVWARSQLCAVG